jgi:glycine/D-amino acid oxidase-like deaminating enzyme
LPGYYKGFIATGIFRNGLQLSPAPAVVMARVMTGAEPGIDLTPFRPDRALVVH